MNVFRCPHMSTIKLVEQLFHHQITCPTPPLSNSTFLSFLCRIDLVACIPTGLMLRQKSLSICTQAILLHTFGKMINLYPDQKELLKEAIKPYARRYIRNNHLANCLSAIVGTPCTPLSPMAFTLPHHCTVWTWNCSSVLLNTRSSAPMGP